MRYLCFFSACLLASHAAALDFHFKHTKGLVEPGFTEPGFTGSRNSDEGSETQWLLVVDAKHGAPTLHEHTDKVIRIPPNGLAVWTTASHAKFLSTVAGVQSVSPFQNEFKYNHKHVESCTPSFDDVEEAIESFDVILFNKGTSFKVDHLLEQWGAKLKGALGHIPASIRAVSPRKLRVTIREHPRSSNGCPSSGMRQVIEWLSSQREVHAIEPSPRPSIPHNGAARELTQTQGVLFDYQYATGTPQDWTSFTDASHGLEVVGLQGHGQIVSVGDTGLDFETCFFHDSSASVNTFDTPSSASFDSSHRKIGAYWSLLDSKD